MKLTVECNATCPVEKDCDYEYVTKNAGIYRPKQATDPQSRLVTVGEHNEFVTLFVGRHNLVELADRTSWYNKTFVIANEEIVIKMSNES